MKQHSCRYGWIQMFYDAPFSVSSPYVLANNITKSTSRQSDYLSSNLSFKSVYANSYTCFTLQLCVWVAGTTWGLSFAYYTCMVLPYKAFDYRYPRRWLCITRPNKTTMTILFLIAATTVWPDVRQCPKLAFSCWSARACSIFRRRWPSFTSTAPSSIRTTAAND
jgi:hypothetical protein